MIAARATNALSADKSSPAPSHGRGLAAILEFTNRLICALAINLGAGVSSSRNPRATLIPLLL